MTPNMERLQTFSQMPLAHLDQLPLLELEQIIQQIEAVKSTVRHYDIVLQSALNRRFGERAQQLRQAAGKETGTVRFDEGDYQVIADLPKRAEYDPAKLREAVATLRGWGETPEDYVSLEIKVAEARYNAWPPAIRKLFEPARTLKTCKPSFKLAPRQAADLSEVA
jgi:hypothetical protein